MHAKRLVPFIEEREQKLREKKWFRSGVVLEWKTLLSIDNRYSLSKAKLNVRREAARYSRMRPFYIHIHIFKGEGNSTCSQSNTQSSMNRICSLSLFTVIHVLLLFFLFFFSFFFFFFFSFYFFSGIGRDMESRFLRVTQPAPFVCWLFFKESRFQNF